MNLIEKSWGCCVVCGGFDVVSFLGVQSDLVISSLARQGED